MVKQWCGYNTMKMRNTNNECRTENKKWSPKKILKRKNKKNIKTKEWKQRMKPKNECDGYETRTQINNTETNNKNE